MIEQVYTDNIDKVYGFFYYKTLNTAISEDLTSETFMIMLHKMNDRDIVIADTKKFLYGIMRNVWLRHLQKKYKEATIDIENIDDFSQHVEITLADEELIEDKDRLKKLIDRLPEKQRQVITMRYLQDMSLSDICDDLGKNMSYVKTTQRRGLRSLEKIIDRLGALEGITQ